MKTIQNKPKLGYVQQNSVFFDTFQKMQSINTRLGANKPSMQPKANLKAPSTLRVDALENLPLRDKEGTAQSSYQEIEVKTQSTARSALRDSQYNRMGQRGAGVNVKIDNASVSTPAEKQVNFTLDKGTGGRSTKPDTKI